MYSIVYYKFSVSLIYAALTIKTNLQSYRLQLQRP